MSGILDLPGRVLFDADSAFAWTICYGNFGLKIVSNGNSAFPGRPFGRRDEGLPPDPGRTAFSYRRFADDRLFTRSSGPQRLGGRAVGKGLSISTQTAGAVQQSG